MEVDAPGIDPRLAEGVVVDLLHLGSRGVRDDAGAAQVVGVVVIRPRRLLRDDPVSSREDVLRAHPAGAFVQLGDVEGRDRGGGLLHPPPRGIVHEGGGRPSGDQAGEPVLVVVRQGGAVAAHHVPVGVVRITVRSRLRDGVGSRIAGRRVAVAAHLGVERHVPDGVEVVGEGAVRGALRLRDPVQAVVLKTLRPGGVHQVRDRLDVADVVVGVGEVLQTSLRLAVGGDRVQAVVERVVLIGRRDAAVGKQPRLSQGVVVGVYGIDGRDEGADNILQVPARVVRVVDDLPAGVGIRDGCGPAQGVVGRIGRIVHTVHVPDRTGDAPELVVEIFRRPGRIPDRRQPTLGVRGGEFVVGVDDVGARRVLFVRQAVQGVVEKEDRVVPGIGLSGEVPVGVVPVAPVPHVGVGHRGLPGERVVAEAGDVPRRVGHLHQVAQRVVLILRRRVQGEVWRGPGVLAGLHEAAVGVPVLFPLVAVGVDRGRRPPKTSISQSQKVVNETEAMLAHIEGQTKSIYLIY